MNNNHIHQWARKSGINIRKSNGNLPSIIDPKIEMALKKFADYASKYERDRCAKICDRMAKDKKFVDVANETARQLAVKIRTVRLG